MIYDLERNSLIGAFSSLISDRMRLIKNNFRDFEIFEIKKENDTAWNYADKISFGVILKKLSWKTSKSVKHFSNTDRTPYGLLGLLENNSVYRIIR